MPGPACKSGSWWFLPLVWTISTAFFAGTIPFEAAMGTPESLGQVIGTLSIPAAEAVFLLCVFVPWRRWRFGLSYLGVMVNNFLVSFWRAVLFVLVTFLLTLPAAMQLDAPYSPLLFGGSIAVGGALSFVPYRRLYVRSLYAIAGRQPPHKADPVLLARLETEAGVGEACAGCGRRDLPLKGPDVQRLCPSCDEKRIAPPPPPRAEFALPSPFAGSVSGGTASPEVIRAWEEAASFEEQKREALKRAREQALRHPQPRITEEEVRLLMDRVLEAIKPQREPLILPKDPEVHRHGGWTAPEQVCLTPSEVWGGISPESYQELLNRQITQSFSVPPVSLGQGDLRTDGTDWALVEKLRGQRRDYWQALRNVADEAAQENRVFTREEQAAGDCYNATIAHIDRMLKVILERRRD